MTGQSHIIDDAGAYETVRLKMVGEALLVVEFGAQLSPLVLGAARAFDHLLQNEKIPGLQESAPTGNAVALVFDPLHTPPELFRQQIRALVEQADWFERGSLLPSACWHLPICYGGDCGPDLAPLADQLCLSENDVIAAHLETMQRVLMIGFAPGFLYTGRLSEMFNLPRLPDIKPCVPAGSVSVALGQSVISSTAHPTGWRVIGRTPFRNFDPAREPAIIINAGDEIRFVQIDQSAYEDLRNRDRHGLWQLEKGKPHAHA
ncbi:MAG: allophanate hydrolase subunit 1 [Hyphomicrobiaceae bacterium]|nr:allophanate hydrolase subunit 1 [Hyphomicrobiaceae bacterium]